jgi:DNA mismatch repair protein MutL
MQDTIAKIQILDDTTANQIAAGEVVERPASAVKELVENALDAGARRIMVELEEGGKYLIRITDDGCGMTQADAILSLQRHATSKITNADDLFRITTMGFRGEALPSIASVSQLTIVTKPDGQDEDETPGTEIRCLGGSLESVHEVGSRSGTSITVENLFYNVPARLKFLKTTATELSHIVELMQRFALSNPGVAFRLMNHNQETFTSPGSGSMMDACVQVFGRETARLLVPMDCETGSVRVTGFIGTPSSLKNNRSSQHTFVNHRFIRNKAVTRAMDEAYKSVQTLHGAKYPPAVVMIEIDPSQVDVNVSPTKTEVRFTREGEVYSAVYHAVKEALMAGGLVPTMVQKVTSAVDQTGFNRPLFSVPPRHPVNTRQDVRETPFHRAYHENGGVSTHAQSDPFDDLLPIPPQLGTTMSPSIDYVGATREDIITEAIDADNVPSVTGGDYRHRNLSSIRVLAQTRNMYILAQTESALVLIDQHIAHERVLYEQLIAGAEGGGAGVPTQGLVIPLTLELTKREALVVEKRLDDLRKAGFDLEPFGGDSFVVRSVPASVAQKRLKVQGSVESVLREIIDEMVEKTVSRRLLLPAEEVLITASCKMAVKAGDPLTFEEMNNLVADLFKSENPYTCPHGRPIIIELPNSDLDRKFGR